MVKTIDLGFFGMISKIFDIVEEGRIPTKNAGIFSIKAVIVSYDYARCFIAERNSEYYAFLEIENGSDLFGWNVAKVSLDDINSVNCGDEPVQSLFTGKEAIFELLFEGGSDAGVLKKVSAFEGKYSIEGKMKVKNFCDMDSIFDYHGLVAEANMQNSDKLSIILQNKNGCNTHSFFKIFNYFNSMCKNLSHPLDIMASTMTVAHASTVITFTFENGKKGLFEGDNAIPLASSESISELGNILSASDSGFLMSHHNKKTETLLKKYGKMIEEFEKTKDPQPKIVIASPKMDKPVSYQMTPAKTRSKKAAIGEAITYIRKSSETQTQTKKFEGLLTGIITSGGNYFGFRAKGGQIINGDVDFKLVSNNQFDVGGTIYRASIDVVRVISQNGDLLKESNRLIGLEPIRKVEKFEQTSLFDEI